MEQNPTTSDELPVPSRKTFNFTAFLEKKATFPTFKHTVYTDQESGLKLAAAIDAYEDLESRYKAVTSAQQRMNEDPGRSLVDDDYAKLTEDLDRIEEKKQALDGEIPALEKKVYESGLILTFQGNTAPHLTGVVMNAEKAYIKRYGKGKNDDYEYTTGKAQAVLIAQIAAYCTAIQPVGDEEQDPPGPEGFAELMAALIPSESVRLMTSLNRALDSSSAWADRVDAGFPGRGNDLGGKPVDSPRPENSQVVGTATDGDSLWSGQPLVG
jgi:hypothetical protein